MAFKIANFQNAGGSSYSGAPRIHTYKTDDALSGIDNADYFLDIWDLLKVGDLIYVLVVTNLDASNEAIADAAFVVVNAVSKTSVDTSDVTDIVVTDSGG